MLTGLFPKGDDVKFFHEALKLVAELPNVRLFNAVVSAKEDERAFEWLLNWIHRAMKCWKSYAILVCDTGKEANYTRVARRMHVYNPIPSQFDSWPDTGSRSKHTN